MAEQRLTAEQAERARRIIWPLLPLLLRTAQYLSGSPQEAEDLAQETALKAMRAIDSFQEGTSAKSWLLMILRRLHIDALRASGRRVRAASLDGESAAEPAAPEGATAAAWDGQWDEPELILECFEDAEVIAALKGLPDEIRWTLLLVDVEDLDHKEAARILEVPEGTVKSRAFRGRALLRDQLFHLGPRRRLVKGSTHDGS